MAMRNQGFTLIELIIVIVLLGIIGTFSFSYLGLGAKIFTDSVGRDQLLNQSRFAVERLSRELRNSLPRSVRVVNGSNYSCIEFVPIIASSSYVQLPRPGPFANNAFIGVTPLLEPGQTIINQYLYVYATNHALIYNGATPRRKQITGTTAHTSPGLTEFTLAGTSTFPTGSLARRFFITEQPVSWCVSRTPSASGTLTRFKGYGFHNTQRTFSQLSSASAEVMAQQLYNDFSSNQVPFYVLPATLQRNSLVQIDFRFGRASDTEPLRIQHEVFVPNVP